MYILASMCLSIYIPCPKAILSPKAIYSLSSMHTHNMYVPKTPILKLNSQKFNMLSYIYVCIQSLDASRSPSAYSLLLTSSDGVDNNQVSLVTNTTVESDRRVILIAAGRLQTNRRWEIAVLAYNCSDHVLLHTNEFSKLWICFNIELSYA